MSDGWCPFIDERRPAPAGNFTPGRLPALAVVLHIMDSSLASCISWFTNPSSSVSAHFGIGKTGRLVQFVSINDTAHANGLGYSKDGRWYTLRGGNAVFVKPTWTRIQPNINPNRTTISIEHEGKPGEPLTPAMKATQKRLLQWLAGETGLVYAVGSTLIGHYHLDNVGRSYCPGPAFDLGAIAAAANREPEPDYPALWGTHFPYFAESGIAAAWRELPMALGAAVSDETSDARGHVWRLFASGAVEFDPKTGKTQVYVPRGKA